ncbi:MAG: hypothetical protein CMI16_07455, partial [Opitutaceae bacterium]|nr:hypothetical protein [Opitutaceae bacterium]
MSERESSREPERERERDREREEEEAETAMAAGRGSVPRWRNSDVWRICTGDSSGLDRNKFERRKRLGWDHPDAVRAYRSRELSRQCPDFDTRFNADVEFCMEHAAVTLCHTYTTWPTQEAARAQVMQTLDDEDHREVASFVGSMLPTGQHGGAEPAVAAGDDAGGRTAKDWKNKFDTTTAQLEECQLARQQAEEAATAKQTELT